MYAYIRTQIINFYRKFQMFNFPQNNKSLGQL